MFPKRLGNYKNRKGGWILGCTAQSITEGLCYGDGWGGVQKWGGWEFSDGDFSGCLLFAGFCWVFADTPFGMRAWQCMEY